jgi:hypothetical protein
LQDISTYATRRPPTRRREAPPATTHPPVAKWLDPSQSQKDSGNFVLL